LSIARDSSVPAWSEWNCKRYAEVSVLSLLNRMATADPSVLPIPRIPSLPACILTAARLLPLEQIFAIPYPPSPMVQKLTL
jgi:hypothetical protein